MLNHLGSERSFSHDLRLAILLCLDAGFVNAAGFIAFAVLTTNVTGHAALLAVNIAHFDFRSAGVVALWLLLFLSGAFFSGVCISKVGRDNPFAYTVPIILIILILGLVAFFGANYDHTLHQTEYFAGSLLFSMGMQNAMVSMISGSVVRTTHLTGMFTDLGIDLSQVVISNATPEIKKRILLRSAIIISFLAGGIIGGISFSYLSFKSFFIPISFLLIALFYDYFVVKLSQIIKK